MSRQTITFSEAWTSGWGNDFSRLLLSAEEAERTLSYANPCRSEAARKETGSYYTPADVSLFFWDEFFSLNGISNGEQFDAFWSDHHFIEPSAGAGALIFGLFAKGVESGLSPSKLAATDLTIIDINQKALDFIQDQLDQLARKWGITFPNIRYLCCDFRECTLPVSPRVPLFFGNPPFVRNSKGSRWKNLFADFIERSVRQCGTEGKCHYILPLSVAFSRDYTRLRDAMRQSGKSIALSSFDNIPDTLFESGKPANTNTNKANSQRCSIVTIFPENAPRILSSKMHRWKKRDRPLLLSSSPIYHDVTTFGCEDQFLRPENDAVLRYLTASENALRMKALVSKSGRYDLNVASVSRNFIGFREAPGTGVHTLRFKTKESFYSALLILSSDLFMDYWRTVGDGFHVTRGNILEFPVHQKLLEVVRAESPMARKFWSARSTFSKTKRYPGGETLSYDFTSSSLALRDHF